MLVRGASACASIHAAAPWSFTLPPRAGRNAGMALLMTHADWVAARLAALPDAMIRSLMVPSVPIHGKPHRIRHVPAGARRRLADDGETARHRRAGFPGPPGRRFPARRGAAPASALRFALKAAAAEVMPRRVVVKDTRSRWGSCAANRTLAFSWRLVMAPRLRAGLRRGA